MLFPLTGLYSTVCPYTNRKTVAAAAFRSFCNYSTQLFLISIDEFPTRPVHGSRGPFGTAVHGIGSIPVWFQPIYRSWVILPARLRRSVPNLTTLNRPSLFLHINFTARLSTDSIMNSLSSWNEHPNWLSRSSVSAYSIGCTVLSVSLHY